jgi:hypothetical protein
MKSIWKWILLGVGFFIAGFCVALPLMGIFTGTPLRLLSGQGLMMSRFPMMGGWGGGPLELVMLAIRCVVPVLIVAGFVVLIVFLVRKPSAGKPSAETPPPPSKVCPGCGKPVETGWVACPHCGAKLE